MLIVNGKKKGYQLKLNGKRQQEEPIREYFPGETNFRITAELPLERKFNEKGFQVMEPVEGMENGISPFGVHQMAGNVWEWVSDWFDATAYQDENRIDPKGPGVWNK